MSDDSLLYDTKRDERKKTALIASAVLVLVQLLFLFTFRNYLDFGHLFTTIAYLAIMPFVFLCLRQSRYVALALCVLALGGLLYVAMGKVNWNERYLQGLTTPQAFILEDYIDKYPTLEQHMLAKTLDRKDWVRFSGDCVAPALRQRPFPDYCRDATAIKRIYRIDIQDEIDVFIRRMQKTAQDVKEGRIRSASQYQQCIASKRCAPIPLLPDHVDADKLLNDKTQHLEVRQAFWDLVEERGLTLHVCNAMTLCKSMVALGVISFGRASSSGADE